MTSHNHNSDVKTTVLAETDNYMLWMAEEPEGETTYNLELGSVTLHMFKEEWDEFLKLVRGAARKAEG